MLEVLSQASCCSSYIPDLSDFTVQAPEEPKSLLMYALGKCQTAVCVAAPIITSYYGTSLKILQSETEFFMTEICLSCYQCNVHNLFYELELKQRFPMIMFSGTEPTGSLLFFLQLTSITWVVSSFWLLLCKEKQPLGCLKQTDLFTSVIYWLCWASWRLRWNLCVLVLMAQPLQVCCKTNASLGVFDWVKNHWHGCFNTCISFFEN